MKIIIDLSENHYLVLQKMKDCGLSFSERAIVDGIVLPEHHGKIIDADELWNKIPEVHNSFENSFTTYDIQNWLDETKAIVEKEALV